MIVYRFTHAKYKNDISGTGAKLKGGRWNDTGVAALYSGSSISLSLLEVLVNAFTLEQLQSLNLMQIEIPVALETSRQKLNQLKKNWHLDFGYTKWIGTQFLQSNNLLILECPSAVIPEENNFILNPSHKDFKQLNIISSCEYMFDSRLLKI